MKAAVDGPPSDGALRLGERLSHASALLHDDSTAAVDLLASHLADATSRAAWSEVAEFAYLGARAHMVQGDLQGALSLIDQARDAWNSVGESLKADRTDLGRMNVLDDLGEHEQAVLVGTELLQRLDRNSTDPDIIWLRAATFKNVGVSHGYLGRHEQALAAYTECEELYRTIGEFDGMALTQANRGVELLEIGELAAAIETFRLAASALEEQGNTMYVARCLAYEGKAQLRAGDYLASFTAIDRAAAILENWEATVERARIDLVRADTLRSLNLLDDAEALYASVGSFVAQEGFVHDHAAAALGQGFVHALQGARAEAIATFELAASLFRSVGDPGQAAVADIARSELLPAADAQTLARETLRLLQTTSRPDERGAALLRCAQLETADDVALSIIDQVDDLLEQHDLPHVRWRSLHERGRRLRSMGRPSEALDALTAAMSAIDVLRSTISRDLERMPFMVSRAAVHSDTVSLLVELGRVDEAYVWVQVARSRTLVEAMAGEVARAHTLPHSVELDRAYSSLVRSPETALSDVFEIASAVKIEAGAPSRDDRDDRDDGVEQPLVGTTVTYQILDGYIAGFVNRDGQVRVVSRLISVDQLEFLRHRLEAQWRRFDDPGLAARHQTHLLTAVTEVLQQLHIALIAPLDVLDSESILVIPHGTIANLPFAAFHDGACHLIERMPVTMAPSELAAKRCQSRSRHHPETSRLVVGVETPETPAVAAEVAALGAYENSTTLTGSSATVDRFVNAASKHDILHIASHGIHRIDNPLFSAIQFADRWLTAGELAGIELEGQLVVLSACSSGRQSSVAAANELDGLPRALLAAGASAVAVNLWPIDDRAAAALMQCFHLHLTTESPSHALRSAQLERMTSKPHPYYWSSTVIIGAPLGNEPSP